MNANETKVISIDDTPKHEAHAWCNDIQCKATDGTVCAGGGGPRWGPSNDWLDPETEDQKTARLFKERVAKDKDRGTRKGY